MVISLLQKYNDMAAAGTPLGIKSAFCHDHLSVRGLVDGDLATVGKVLWSGSPRSSKQSSFVDEADLALLSGRAARRNRASPVCTMAARGYGFAVSQAAGNRQSSRMHSLMMPSRSVWHLLFSGFLCCQAIFRSTELNFLEMLGFLEFSLKSSRAETNF